ncbi:MAG: CDF family Co(II)/Ni(II) efflux transporter DmeF [Acidobacteriota bacterium]
MHRHVPEPTPTHDHDFEVGNPFGERRTWIVVALTSAMMLAEILGGWWFGSMALLADGWHMATHAVALGITGMAYALARKHRLDPGFAFGTWKIEVLGGFASSIVLAIVALYMVGESIARLISPSPVLYDQALWVAAVGLAVNVVCALLLKHDHTDAGHGAPNHSHAESPDHAHDHHHTPSGEHHDLNLKAAYLHVLADALTSVLAIVALLGARSFGWVWLDPVMGIVGSALVARWAIGLMRETSRVLLDREMGLPLVEQIRASLESDGDARVCDLHVWRVARRQFACIATVVADQPKTPQQYKQRLEHCSELAHVTVEVLRCEEHDRVGV